MAEGRLETESRCQECLAIIKGEITSNNLSKRRVRTRTHGVVGGRGLVAPSYPIIPYIFLLRSPTSCGGSNSLRTRAGAASAFRLFPFSGSPVDTYFTCRLFRLS